MHSPSIHPDIDPARVVSELKAAQSRELISMLSPGQVRLDRETREACGGDESPLPPAIPAAVVYPRSTPEVASVLAFANRERIPVTPRGAGTGKVGGAIPLYGGLVLALERMNRILDIDTANRLACVEPGVVNNELRTQVEARGLFYPPNPNSLDECTLGGNVASNAAGPCSMKYGATRSYVRVLEIVLADGKVLRMGRRTTKCSTGYDLSALLVGSEGTLGVITEITLGLRVLPSASRTLFAVFPSPAEAIGALEDLYRGGIVPSAAEFFDRHALEAISASARVPEGAGAALLLELDGTEASIDEMLERLLEALGERAKDVAVATNRVEARRLWEARKLVSATIKERFACRRSEDIAVPPAHLPKIVAFIEALRVETGIRVVTYGHAGDGNLHVNFLYQERERHLEVEGAVERLFRRTLELGGTLSGEHGIGATKRRYLELEQSDDLIALQKQLRAVLDPHGVLNPGKVFP